MLVLMAREETDDVVLESNVDSIDRCMQQLLEIYPRDSFETVTLNCEFN